MTKWRSAATAPREGVFDAWINDPKVPEGVRITNMWFDKEDGVFTGDDMIRCVTYKIEPGDPDFTHWMPWPEPPP